MKRESLSLFVKKVIKDQNKYLSKIYIKIPSAIPNKIQ